MQLFSTNCFDAINYVIDIYRKIEVTKNDIIDENNKSLLQDVRRQNLKNIIDKYFFSVSALADRIGVERANLSAIISGTRVFSSNMSHRIENTLDLPQGYLSQEDGGEFSIEEYLTIRYCENINDIQNPFILSDKKIPRNFLSASQNSKIIATKMPDNLMEKNIYKDDIVFIDCSHTSVNDGSTFLFEYLNFYNVRRLQILKKGIVQVNIDNKEITYTPIELDLSSITVVGKVINSVRSL